MRDKNQYYKKGDWNAICDVCGFKFKASQLRRRWDGMRVCQDDYEARHPQDLIKGKRDDSSVPWTRSEGINMVVTVNPNDPDDVTYTAEDGAQYILIGDELVFIGTDSALLGD